MNKTIKLERGTFIGILIVVFIVSMTIGLFIKPNEVELEKNKARYGIFDEGIDKCLELTVYDRITAMSMWNAQRDAGYRRPSLSKDNEPIINCFAHKSIINKGDWGIACIYDVSNVTFFIKEYKTQKCTKFYDNNLIIIKR